MWFYVIFNTKILYVDLRLVQEKGYLIYNGLQSNFIGWEVIVTRLVLFLGIVVLIVECVKEWGGKTKTFR